MLLELLSQIYKLEEILTLAHFHKMGHLDVISYDIFLLQFSTEKGDKLHQQLGFLKGQLVYSAR